MSGLVWLEISEVSENGSDGQISNMSCVSRNCRRSRGFQSERRLSTPFFSWASDSVHWQNTWTMNVKRTVKDWFAKPDVTVARAVKCCRENMLKYCHVIRFHVMWIRFNIPIFIISMELCQGFKSCSKIQYDMYNFHHVPCAQRSNLWTWRNLEG